MSGASATGLPVGTTNAIGRIGPDRGGASEAGRSTGAVARWPRRSGSGSSRASSPAVSRGSSGVTTALLAAIRGLGTRAISAPADVASSNAIVGRAELGAGGTLATGVGAATGAGLGVSAVGVRHAPVAVEHAAQRQSSA